MSDRVKEALDGLSARELEQLREQIDRRLAVCIIDGADGALPVRAISKSVAFTLMLCPACIERYRTPEGRSQPSSQS
jgi:hypothetical protein